MLVYLPMAWVQYILLIIAPLAEQITLFDCSHTRDNTLPACIYRLLAPIQIESDGAKLMLLSYAAKQEHVWL